MDYVVYNNIIVMIYDQINAMWLTRVYHVIPRYSPLLHAACEPLMRCHENHMTCCILCAPKKVVALDVI